MTDDGGNALTARVYLVFDKDFSQMWETCWCLVSVLHLPRVQR